MPYRGTSRFTCHNLPFSLYTAKEIREENDSSLSPYFQITFVNTAHSFYHFHPKFQQLKLLKLQFYAADHVKEKSEKIMYPYFNLL